MGHLPSTLPLQTVAGALATGTHGSTLMDGSLSSQVMTKQRPLSFEAMSLPQRSARQIQAETVRVPQQSLVQFQ